MDNLEALLPQHKETKLVFFVNGKKVVEEKPDPEWTLLWYLRKKLHLTGTKYGCGEGGCGACTVMVSQYYKHEDRIKHIAVNACLTPLCSVHGLAVTTVEGIGSTQDRLHPIQERIAKMHGSQCGFCTPGFVMSMYALIRTKNKIDYNNIERALQGNLCRCTGYRPIIDAFKTFIEPWEKNFIQNGQDSIGGCAMGKDCCKLKNVSKENLFDKCTFQPYSSTQEPIFPPELKLNSEYSGSFLFFKGTDVVWIRPNKLEQLLEIKQTFPTSKIVVGNTEIGIEVKFKKVLYPILIYPVIINEMNFVRVTDSGVEVGAAVTLSELISFIKNIEVKSKNMQTLEAISDMLQWFAGNQVRNVASLVGNIVTASPVSDINPILMACSATLNVRSLKRGQRKIVIDEAFFVSYRKVAIAEDEVVFSVEIPFTEDLQFFKAYKQARRREDDMAIVTAAFNVQLEKNSDIVSNVKICYGGVAPTTVCAMQTSNAIKNCRWNEELLKTAFDTLTNELQLDDSAPGGQVLYRKSLCLSLFFRFYLYVSNHIRHNGTSLKNNELSGIFPIQAPHPASSQCFEIRRDQTSDYDAVGKPVVHSSAFKQAAGEAIYCDDIPIVEGELFLCLIMSSECHAKIKSIDPIEALSLPGVKAFLSAADLSEDRNKLGCVIKDEEIFTKEIVTSRACIIGAVIAETESIARKAKNLVRVTYEKIQPAIITIEDAITHKSFFAGYPQTLRKGNVEQALSESENIIEGFVRSGAQEHFYLETISAFASRKEDELEIICTSQNPAEISVIASETLGIPIHRVVTKVKRIGGGFGGKESRALVLAIPVALAAYKLKKPIRAVFDRDEDMQITGFRHPFLIKYKAGFTNEGKITGVILDVYCNAGNSMDISFAMLDKAMTHIDNCYYIPNIQVNGYLCKTNLPSNTAFRGFGGPQGMMAPESIIRDIAARLNKEYEEVIATNFYREGDLTHFNQKLTHCTLARCWEECIRTSDYWERKKSVSEFNSSYRWKKKSISILPTKFGISFQMDVLMQGGALLLVFTDGSVLLSIGGIEMGQGLFTKMIQVASRCLGIESSKIHISEMATDKVPNSTATAASLSSDIYGMAVIDASNKIIERLKPFKTKNPQGSWEDWVSAAYLDRVSLSATGFYALPKIEYRKETNSGKLYEYFTYGVACSEVIVDCLTGDHQVLRTDIVMDVGESLNPAIDIGQIEGAFVQGYGFYTLEEILFSPKGEILSRGPGTYKIPGISDIPKIFNVSLLKGAPNPRAVYSSKAVGEPPLFLAASVFFAIKEAISAARVDAGASPEFNLEVPATCARIRMACVDGITDRVMVKSTKEEAKTPWNITV